MSLGLGPLLQSWSPGRSYGLLTIGVVLCLAPFLSTAFHIDDPLFIWAAQHIAQHPTNPYGFNVLWYTSELPMSVVTENPPLSSYYGAVIGHFAGWSERALHLGFILPALGVILGGYRLARRFCRTPLLAAGVSLLTPGILVSAGTVMCDIMMLAFWIFAVVFWIEGLERADPVRLSASGLLIAASALTKYYGISLIPLLLIYGLVRQRRIGTWTLYFLIPVAALTGYQLWTSALYGRGLLLFAVQYAGYSRGTEEVSLISKGLVCIGFVGGCMLPALTFAPILWSRWGVFIGAILSVGAALAVGSNWTNAGALVPPVHGTMVISELALCVGSGVSVLALAASDLWKRRDADALLLGLWVLGTLLFAGFVNWTVNSRSVLPLIPVVGILLVRRLEAAPVVSPRRLIVKLGLPLLATGILSLSVAWADADLANSARRAAQLVHDQAASHGGRVWFQGHWGFQYYMEALGGRPLDFSKQEVNPGDLVVTPENNNNTRPLNADLVDSDEVIEVQVHPWLTTMNRQMGAGFYFYRWGPLPFAFDAIPPERYHLLRLKALPGRHAQD